MNIAEVHATANSKIQAFFRHLANFLTGFLTDHLQLLESSSNVVVDLISNPFLILMPRVVT